MLEQRWYIIKGAADNPLFLEQLTDEELAFTDAEAHRGHDPDLRAAVKNEERKRYLASINAWLKKPVPANESDRAKQLEECNEIVRIGLNDYNNYLIDHWHSLSKKADRLAADSSDSAKTRYGSFAGLVDALMDRKLGRMVVYGKLH
jgi:hypothetical protein